MADRSDPTRRGLLLTGVGLAGAALGGPASATQQQGGVPTPAPDPPVPTRPSARPSPKLKRPLPEPPGQRVGWAIVGLGKFALGQIMPAFSDCRLSRPVALVSGSPDKACDVGARFGVQRFYDYRNFDAIRDNPAIQVVYVILPNSMHEEYTVRGCCQSNANPSLQDALGSMKLTA